MPSRNALIQHDAPLPTQIIPPLGVISGVDAVFPYLLALYNGDEAARVEMSSYCKGNSQNGAVWCDKARIVQKVKALANKNGSNPMITDTDDDVVSRWCSWGARKLDGIARSKRLAQAKQQERLASQAPTQPDDTN